MGSLSKMGKIGKTVVDDRCRWQAIFLLLWGIVARTYHNGRLSPLAEGYNDSSRCMRGA